MLKARETANAEQLKQIDEWLVNDGNDKVPAMLELFKATGADKACREAVELYSNRAFDCLEEAAVLRKRKQPLHELATYLLQRDR